MVNSHPPVIVLDACMLTASIRRHLVLVCADAGLFIPVWSDRIMHETRRAIPKALNASAVPADRAARHAEIVCTLMHQAFPDANAKFDYDGPLPDLPDRDDLHVVALALSTGAATIVTENLRDFPARRLASFALRATNTDNFLAELFSQNSRQKLTISYRLLRALNRPETDFPHMISRLKSVGLKKTAKILTTE